MSATADCVIDELNETQVVIQAAPMSAEDRYRDVVCRIALGEQVPATEIASALQGVAYLEIDDRRMRGHIEVARWGYADFQKRERKKELLQLREQRNTKRLALKSEYDILKARLIAEMSLKLAPLQSQLDDISDANNADRMELDVMPTEEARRSKLDFRDIEKHRRLTQDRCEALANQRRPLELCGVQAVDTSTLPPGIVYSTAHDPAAVALSNQKRFLEIAELRAEENRIHSAFTGMIDRRCTDWKYFNIEN